MKIQKKKWMPIIQKIGKRIQLENGEYNAWNFNEEDLEEGDYYYREDDNHV